MTFRNVMYLMLLIVLAPWSDAGAWTNHALITYMALDGAPGINDRVKVETIQSFLSKEGKKISEALEREEQWARANVRDYSPRPDALAFASSGEKDILVRFLRAVRLNPGMTFPLFAQPRDVKDGRPRASWGKVSMNPNDFLKRPLVVLRPGEMANTLEVIASASDEPDYGYDFGLHDNNGTPYGAVYGYGPQPISDPAEFTYTQAAFHMGFYHESWIVFKAAPVLKKTCPEQRAHLFYSLSRLAFETGHPYWGYRFAGMGLHYIQDLAQPFHACTLPGVSTLRLLWISALHTVGITGPYERAVARVTNEHTLLETHCYDLMRGAFDGGEGRDSSLLTALADRSTDAARGAYDGHYIENNVSLEAYNRADVMIDALNGIITDRALFDKTSALDRAGKFNAGAVIKGAPEQAEKNFQAVMASIMKSIGSHSRVYIKAAAGI